ncbi:MAG: C39 family peptidase [Clostridia bacterium]
MAHPIAAVGMIIRNIAADILSDPEKLMKNIFLFFIVPILILLLIFAVPIMLIHNVPAIMLKGSNLPPELEAKQIEVITFYQEAPAYINEDNLKWIDQMESSYSYCDDIVVSYSFDLSWQHLMSVDSVLLEQDFEKANINDVISLGFEFVDRYVDVETYYEEETHYSTWTDEEGNEYEDSYTVIVEKQRAIINVHTKPFEYVLNGQGFNQYEKDIAFNIYNTIANSDIEGNLNLYDSDIDLSNLKEYPPGNARLPYFNQTDKRWGLYSYGKTGTIASGGCGPTALAMVVSGLKGRSDINPKGIADWSVANGHRAEGAGSYWSLMTEGAYFYGLKVEAVSRANPQRIVQALSEGYPVIVSMGRGHFTKSGHFIVLSGITAEGKILVQDPISLQRSNQAWDLSIIMNESSTNAGVYGSPFWIYKP